MFKFKTINLANPHLFGAALLATTVTYSLNPAPAKSTSSQELQLEEIAVGEQNPTSIANDRASIALTSTELSETNLLLAQAADSDSADEDSEQSQKRLLRIISLGFLLLFFVPLGIFYPLFLFYRMLLTKPKRSAKNLADRSESNAAKSVGANNRGSSTIEDPHQATVSKLQIAFSPPARELRKELSRVSSIAHRQAKTDIVVLMHQTINILIEQGYWTHVSHSSETFPLDEVKPEFDRISERERYKFSQEQPGLINYNRNVSSADGYERNYSYVVVTLILCTAHSAPLFQTISTKEQLVEELTQLTKIQDKALIKFELLWNPQQEDIYISNDQLLIEYDEMTRLL